MESEIVHYGGNLSYNIQVWNGQRILDEERVKIILEYQLKYFEEYKEFDMYFWSFSGCLFDDTIYIIDGQHRKEVYDRLKIENKLPKIAILIRKVNHDNQILQSFQVINKSKPQDIVDLQNIKIDKDSRLIAIEGVKLYRNNHKSIFTEKKATKPKINSLDLSNSISIYNILEVEEINELLERFNDYCFNNIDEKNIKKEHMKEAKKSNCYIGLTTRCGNKGWSFY